MHFINTPAKKQAKTAELASSTSPANTATSIKTTKLYTQAIITKKANIQIPDSQQSWQTVKNKKTATAAKKTDIKALFSYRERRLILLNSRESNLDSIKIRDQINQELKK